MKLLGRPHPQGTHAGEGGRRGWVTDEVLIGVAYGDVDRGVDAGRHVADHAQRRG